MTHTEFWDVLRRVFPDGQAESIAKDFVLPQVGSRTCEEALAAGVKPLDVWKALIGEMGLPASYEYLHRKRSRRES
ncbi:DUF3046 domain-containing protein [Arcanobacterium hippocoleae]